MLIRLGLKVMRFFSSIFWFFLGVAVGSLGVIYIPNFREKVVVAFKESSKRAIAFVENNILSSSNTKNNNEKKENKT